MNGDTVLFVPRSTRAKEALWRLWTLSLNVPSPLEAKNSQILVLLQGKQLSPAGCSQAVLWSALLNTVPELTVSLRLTLEFEITYEFGAMLPDLTSARCGGKNETGTGEYMRLCITGMFDYQALDALSTALHKMHTYQTIFDQFKRNVGPACPIDAIVSVSDFFLAITPSEQSGPLSRIECRTSSSDTRQLSHQ